MDTAPRRAMEAKNTNNRREWGKEMKKIIKNEKNRKRKQNSLLIFIYYLSFIEAKQPYVLEISII